MSSTEVIYRHNLVLLVELIFSIQHILHQNDIFSLEGLLATCAMQLDYQDKNVAKPILRLRRYYKQNKEYFNKAHNVRNKELRCSNLVLVFNLVQYQDISTTRKLALRQLGLYYIANVYKGLRTYILIELDRS